MSAEKLFDIPVLITVRAKSQAEAEKVVTDCVKYGVEETVCHAPSKKFSSWGFAEIGYRA